MALIWFDGFDHYGLDETKLTEGPYDQADSAFTLSEVNPRTGNRHLKRSNVSSDNVIIKSLDGEKTAIGSALTFYIDQLPTESDSYILSDFRDSNGDVHLSFLITPSGSVKVMLGVSDGVIAESNSNLVQAGAYQHIEIAAIPNTIDPDVDESQEVFIVSKNMGGWKYLIETQGAETDASSKNFDDSLWLTGQASFYNNSPHPYLPSYGWDSYITVIGPEKSLWMRRTITTVEGTLDFNLAFDNSPRLFVDGVEITITKTPTIPGTQGQWAGAASVAVFSGSHTVAYQVTETTIPNPTNYFFSDMEVTITPQILGTNGMVEVRLNGVTIISASDSATTNTENKEFSFVALTCGSDNPHGVTTYIDDWFIWDDSGAWNNSFLGDRRSFLLPPNQDTNLADFEPSEGSFGYKMIDEDSPDDDSTFIFAEADLLSGSPLSGTSEFEIENAAAGVSLISAVMVVSRAAKTDETSAELSTSINSGSNSVSSAAHTLTTSYQYYSDVYEYDPATIANLTRDGVNSLSVSVTAEDLDSGEESPGEESPGEEIAVPWGSRAVFGGGRITGSVDTIDYVEIATPGNAVDFGNLTQSRFALAAASDGSRAVFGGGRTTDSVNTIDYVEIATPGNAVDFGDLTQSRRILAAASDGSRAVFGGGFTTDSVNTIDYVEIATPGNAVDFGNLTQSRYFLAAASDGSRAVFGGGITSVNVDTIDYVEIATPGNAVDFGDLTQSWYALAAASDGSRAVFGGGFTSVNVDTIDYVEIATPGNAVDFGDLTQARHALAAASDGSRAVFGGGLTSVVVNTIDYVEIATPGNAVDFGDLTQARHSLYGTSGA